MKWHKVIITYQGNDTLIHDGSSDKSKIRISGGKIKNAINSIGTFSFDVYPDNPGYDKLFGLRTKIKVITDTKTLFIGRVLTVSDSMDENGTIIKSVLCEDRMGWLCDTVQPYREWDLEQGIRPVFEYMLAAHNSKAPAKKILCGAVTVTAVNSYNYLSNWDTTLETISQKLIANYGGELQLRDSNGDLYLDYLDRIGSGTDTTIKLAVNMKTISRTIDETSVISRLYPLGAKLEGSEDRLKLSGMPYIQDAAMVAKYGVQEKIKIWNDVTTQAALRTKAQAYLNNVNKSKKQYKISALDLAQAGYTDFEAFELGNIYHVDNSIMGIDEDLRIIGITYSIEKPYESELTFGDKFETMTGFTVNKSKQVEDSLVTENMRSYDLMDSKIANATALITGAQGGYVILDPSEKPSRILIMDTADINTATSCIQLNKAGLGFWKASDGGSAATGPYTNAWTIDGNLVASFITALTLTGQKINNGNGTFRVDANGNVTANSFSSNNATITGGSINIQTSGTYYDVIKLRYTDDRNVTANLFIGANTIHLTASDVSGHTYIEADNIIGKWNSEYKFILNASSGDITTHTDGGKLVFYVHTNDHTVSVFDSNQKEALRIDAENHNLTVFDSNEKRSFFADAKNHTLSMFNGNDLKFHVNANGDLVATSLNTWT